MSQLPEFPAAARVAEVPVATLAGALPPGVEASDYQWLSLKSWNPDGRVAQLRGSMVVDFTSYHGDGVRHLGFAGGHDPSGTASQLIEALRQDGRPVELRLIDESTTSALDDDYLCEPDRDNADYLFSTAELTGLAGRGHAVLRNQIRRFERRFGKRAHIELPDLSNVPWTDLIELKEKWAANSARPEEAEDEVRAFRRCVDTITGEPAPANVVISVLTLDGVPAGFDMTEITRDGWALLHFRHTPHELVGSYGYLVRGVAQHLLDTGVTRWNAEQDLGVPGLRMRKTRDRPIRLIEKCRVRPMTS